MRYITAISMLIAAGCSVSAYAAVSDVPASKMPIKNVYVNNPTTAGTYFNGNIANYKSVNTTLRHNQSKGMLINLAAGLHLSQYISTEIGYLYLPAQTLASNAGIMQNSYNALAVAIKGVLPISHTGLHIFAKVGPSLNFTTKANISPGNNSNNISANSQQEGLLYGFGMDYSLNDSLAVSLQYLSTIQSNTDSHNKVSSSLISYIQHDYGIFSLNYLLQ